MGYSSDRPTMATNKVRRKCSYFVLGMYYFMEGIEYAVVLPTLWLYISRQFHTQQYVLGILLAAFSFASLISSPMYGWWLDVSQKPRLILSFGILWQIAGNIMYFMGISEWFLLGSRLVNGLGSGAASVILAEVSRATTEEERTGILSTLISMRQVGIMLGPGLNVFLRLADFKIGPFIVGKYSAPGAFMACAWFIQGLLIFILYTDLQKIKQQEVAEKTAELKHQSESESYDPLISQGLYQNDYTDISQTETRQEIDSVVSYGSINQDADVENTHPEKLNIETTPKLTLNLLYNAFIREEIIVLFAVQFNSYFNQVAMETIVTPLSDKLLHWKEIENSVMYCCVCIEIFAVFILVRFLSKKFADRTLILFGCILMTIAHTWFIVVIPRCSPDTPKENLPYIIVWLVICTMAMPFLGLCSMALYSKLINKEIQGLSMGIRRSVAGLAFVMAPMWAGSTLNYPYIMCGVMIGLLVMCIMMQIISFQKLKPSNLPSPASVTQKFEDVS